MWYRIIDYITTTSQEQTQSAGHPFDIIVLALSEDTLSEDARAIKTTREGGDYFSECNLCVWKLKYSLDNNANKFGWVGIYSKLISKGYRKYENSTGIEGYTEFYTWNPIEFFPNMNPYSSLENLQKDNYGDMMDFLTIKELLPNGDIKVGSQYGDGSDAIVFSVTHSEDPIYKVIYPTGVIYQMIDEFSNDLPYDFKNIQFSYKYTFGDNEDKTLTGNCYNNKMGQYIRDNKLTLPKNSFGDNCYNNIIGDNCQDNFFGDNCYNNIIGDNCCYNTCYGNIFRNNIMDNCQNNTFSRDCSLNTIGDYFQNNTIGTDCYNNTFGDLCIYNIFWSSYKNNTVGKLCSNNTFGNHCQNNTIGEYCSNNTFGEACSNITFGYSCENNTIGSVCFYFTFVNNCSNNTIVGGCSNIIFRDNCQYLSVNTNVFNLIFLNSIRGISDSNPFIIDDDISDNTTPRTIQQVKALVDYTFIMRYIDDTDYKEKTYYKEILGDNEWNEVI